MTNLELVKRSPRRLATNLMPTEPQRHFPISRFVFPDFTTHGPWLMDKLHKKWPQVTDRSLVGWLKGCIDQSAFHFVKTAHAVALSEIVHKPLCSIPDVREVFVLVDGKPDSYAEGAALYAEMKGWAKNIGAKEIIICSFSDVSPTLIREAIGPLGQKVQMVIEVTP